MEDEAVVEAFLGQKYKVVHRLKRLAGEELYLNIAQLRLDRRQVRLLGVDAQGGRAGILSQLDRRLRGRAKVVEVIVFVGEDEALRVRVAAPTDGAAAEDGDAATDNQRQCHGDEDHPHHLRIAEEAEDAGRPHIAGVGADGLVALVASLGLSFRHDCYSTITNAW